MFRKIRAGVRTINTHKGLTAAAVRAGHNYATRAMARGKR